MVSTLHCTTAVLYEKIYQCTTAVLEKTSGTRHFKKIKIRLPHSTSLHHIKTCLHASHTCTTAALDKKCCAFSTLKKKTNLATSHHITAAQTKKCLLTSHTFTSHVHTSCAKNKNRLQSNTKTYAGHKQKHVQEQEHWRPKCKETLNATGKEHGMSSCMCHRQAHTQQSKMIAICYQAGEIKSRGNALTQKCSKLNRKNSKHNAM